MKRLLIVILIVVILSCLMLALKPLCWKIGWDLKVHKAKCWSNEFTDETAVPSATPTKYTIPPFPTRIPTETVSFPPVYTDVPYPPPIQTPNPYP